jgi:pyruvate/2-oxoglutarate dehydrogenase complex dihydrolipoamide acyltransferase (E2) component
MNRLIIVALALSLPHMAHAIYKCKAAGGGVAYSDSACTSANESRKIDGLPIQFQPQFQAPQTPAAPAQAAQPPQAQPQRSVPSATRPASRQADAASDSGSRLLAVAAVLENLELDGQDCSWALQGEGRKMEACARFLPQMMNKGAWHQAMSELRSLMADREFMERSRTQVEQAKRLADRVYGHSQFATSRLFSGR